MNSSGKYDFKQFQDELAALDRQKAAEKPAASKPVERPAAAPVAAGPAPEKRKRGRPPKVDPLADARLAFDALRTSYGLTVADVVAWFPEEEGVAYLQALIASAEPKPRKRRTKPEPDPG
ncbi:MAG: 2-hydroxyacyl-CoA dehydratase [Luteibacter sp.]